MPSGQRAWSSARTSFRLASRACALVPGKDLVGLALGAAFFTGWLTVAAGRVRLDVLLFHCGYLLVLAIAGQVASHFLPAAITTAGGLPLRLLAGYLVVNSALTLLVLTLPLALPWSVTAVAVGVVGVGILCGESLEPPPRSPALPGLACVALSLLASTLWCRGALRALEAVPGGWVAKPWVDSFTHSRLIAMLAHAEGPDTLHNLLVGALPAFPYHYASYSSPAALVAVTGVPALDALTAFQVPLGIFFTGLAAFVLASSLWGSWAGVAAAAALLLLPDAAQHGVGNHFYSYHWLQQIAPAAPFGVAVAALAWACILEGCRTGRFRPVLVGWAIGAACATYKAHFFVANAFLWWIYPPLFFRGVPGRRRAIWLVVAAATFGVVVRASQSLDRVPRLRLDWSALAVYPSIVLQQFEDGPVGRLASSSAPAGEASRLHQASWAAAMLLVVTFGLLLPALMATLARLRAGSDKAVALFPVLIIVNYLVMALGLPLDYGGMGTPEELLHRPFAWAWFATCTWTAGAAYYAMFGSQAPPSRLARGCLLLAAALCVAFPLALGPGIHGGPPFRARFVRVHLPRGLVDASRFLRAAADEHDLIQDSSNDPSAIVSGLSERQAFVITRTRALPELAAYLEQADTLRGLSTVEALEAFALRTGLDWYLLRPEDSVAWPRQVTDHPVFASDRYRVYRLPRR